MCAKNVTKYDAKPLRLSYSAIAMVSGIFLVYCIFVTFVIEKMLSDDLWDAWGVLGFYVPALFVLILGGWAFFGSSFVACLRAPRKIRHVAAFQDGLVITHGNGNSVLPWAQVTRVNEEPNIFVSGDRHSRFMVRLVTKDTEIGFADGSSVRIPFCVQEYKALISAARAGMGRTKNKGGGSL